MNKNKKRNNANRNSQNSAGNQNQPQSIIDALATKNETFKQGHSVSQEQIDAWKNEHGEIFKLTVEGHVAFLKKPGRKAIGYASSIGTKDPIKFNEIILKACWVAGDEKIQTDDELFMAAGRKLAELIVIKQAELEKL